MPLVQVTKNGTTMQVDSANLGIWTGAGWTQVGGSAPAPRQTPADTSGTVTDAGTVNSLYQKYFNRPATVAELQNWQKEPAASLDSFLQREQVKYGVSPTPTSTPTSMPIHTPSSAVVNVIGGVDVSGLGQSGREVMAAIANHLDTQTANGNVINPNIRIDSTTIEGYLQQAKAELGPGFAQQYAQAKQDTANAMGDISGSYAARQRSLAGTFAKNLEATQQSYANRGLEFSSGRTKAEQDVAAETNAALLANETDAQRQAREAGLAAERTLGSANLGTSATGGITTGQRAVLGLPGAYGLSAGGQQTLYTPTGGTTGTIQSSEFTEEQKRANELKYNNERTLAQSLL